MKRQLEKRILGAALDAGPHEAGLLGTVSTASGDEDEGHAGIETAEDVCGRDGVSRR